MKRKRQDPSSSSSSIVRFAAESRGRNLSSREFRKQGFPKHDAKPDQEATKPPETTNTRTKMTTDLCCFCQDERAVICVPILSTTSRSKQRGNSKKSMEAFCLRHYYTTPAVRMEPNKETQLQVLDPDNLKLQLKPMQQLFAEAFLQLQQEIAEESAKAFTVQQKDPLAILHNLHQKIPSHTRRPNSLHISNNKISKKSGSKDSGGFLPTIALPDRLREAQQKQEHIHADWQKRIEHSPDNDNPYSNNSNKTDDFSKRRKSSRKSIWNVVLNNDTKHHPNGATPNNKYANTQPTADPSHDKTEKFTFLNDTTKTTSCRCGSDNVESLGVNTSRNQDMRKGETWGMKERGEEVIARLQCQSCGRIWTEEL